VIILRVNCIIRRLKLPLFIVSNIAVY